MTKLEQAIEWAEGWHEHLTHQSEHEALDVLIAAARAAQVPLPEDVRARIREIRSNNPDWDALKHYLPDMLESLARTAQVPREQWISVKDRLPTHNYSVLGHVVAGGLIIGEDDWYIAVVSYIKEAGGWKESCGEPGNDDLDVTVTHWMDLPAAPKAGEAQPCAICNAPTLNIAPLCPGCEHQSLPKAGEVQAERYDAKAAMPSRDEPAAQAGATPPCGQRGITDGSAATLSDAGLIAYGEILKIAASLARGEGCVSEYREDHDGATINAILRRVAAQNDMFKDWAVRLRKAADTLHLSQSAPKEPR